MKWYGALLPTLSGLDIISTTQKKKLTRSMFGAGKGYPAYIALFGPYTERSELVKVIRKMKMPVKHEYDMGVVKKRKMNKNPMLPNHISTAGATEIYDHIYAIEAKKGKRSLWPKGDFRHDFTAKGTKIYGLQDGSILIRGKRKLWKNFDYPDDVSDYG